MATITRHESIFKKHHFAISPFSIASCRLTLIVRLPSSFNDCGFPSLEDMLKWQ